MCGGRGEQKTMLRKGLIVEWNSPSMPFLSFRSIITDWSVGSAERVRMHQKELPTHMTARLAMEMISGGGFCSKGTCAVRTEMLDLWEKLTPGSNFKLQFICLRSGNTLSFGCHNLIDESVSHRETGSTAVKKRIIL